MTTVPRNLQFGPHYDIAVRTAAGARAHCQLENQDNFLLIDAAGMARFLDGQVELQQHVPDWPAGHIRMAVLDGMGGHGHGREAAEAVVTGLLAMPACKTLGELSSRLDLLHARLQQHFAAQTLPGKRPGTTLTMLELRPGQAALLYHVGDSRLYEVRAGQAAPLTIDHVPATACAMEGLLNQAAWWEQVHGEHRSHISQAFILGNAFADPAQLTDALFALSPDNLPPFLHHLADRRALQLNPKAVYVLATDGFWACPLPQEWLARWPALLDGASSAVMNARLFAEISNEPPQHLHPDNITAIVLRVLSNTDDTALPVRVN